METANKEMNNDQSVLFSQDVEKILERQHQEYLKKMSLIQAMTDTELNKKIDTVLEQLHITQTAHNNYCQNLEAIQDIEASFIADQWTIYLLNYDSVVIDSEEKEMTPDKIPEHVKNGIFHASYLNMARQIPNFEKHKPSENELIEMTDLADRNYSFYRLLSLSLRQRAEILLSALTQYASILSICNDTDAEQSNSNQG